MLRLHIIYTYILLNYKINVNLAANITNTYPTDCPINVLYINMIVEPNVLYLETVCRFNVLFYNMIVTSNVLYLGTFFGALCYPITFCVVTLTLIGFISIRKCKLTAKNIILL